MAKNIPFKLILEKAKDYRGGYDSLPARHGCYSQ